MSNPVSIIKVAATSRPAAVAGAIAGMVREGKNVTIQAIGAAAVNQAVKSIATARSYLKEDNIDISFIPTFAEVMIDEQERTAVRMQVLRRCSDDAEAAG